MSSIQLLEKSSRSVIRDHWLDRLSRHFVFKLFENIKYGRLTIREGDAEFHFGEKKECAELTATILALHPSAYRMILLNGTVGSGEAYMLNTWDSPDLVAVIQLMVRNQSLLKKMNSHWSLLQKVANSVAHWQRKNSREGSKLNIAAHYDLGNDFFSQFLDETMLYSSAIFANEDTPLFDASQYKMRNICERLQLKADDHLLEIGTGWGGLAVYAAKQYGCKVTTVTISKEQWQYAQEWVLKENLQDRVTVLLRDYRDVQGQFDKIVSVEMIEAVGHEYLNTFFDQCSKLLSPNGLMMIQAITIADQRYSYAKKNVDFIQRYIFPGGCLPSIEILSEKIARYTDMQIIGLQDITLHYARTLEEWRKRFHQQKNVIKNMGFDHVFMRMWEFYLCYCEGGFRERAISTIQLLCAKPLAKNLPNI